jgi:hypothetical protein
MTLTAPERLPALASRIKGRPALVRSLSLLLIRVARFATHRAHAQADQQWAARLQDDLTVALRNARQEIRR